jgi:hypothetical protein
MLTKKGDEIFAWSDLQPGDMYVFNNAAWFVIEILPFDNVDHLTVSCCWQKNYRQQTIYTWDVFKPQGFPPDSAVYRAGKKIN